jgi:hypothetical protein
VRGDEAGVLRRLEACDARCRAGVRTAIARTRGPGEVKLVRTDERGDDVVRVVWVRGSDGVPVVQCFGVRREGTPFSGRAVRLLRVGAPLADNEDPC